MVRELDSQVVLVLGSNPSIIMGNPRVKFTIYMIMLLIIVFSLNKTNCIMLKYKQANNTSNI